MVPVRLHVRNFLSYGENLPPLELAGLRMVCLSGPNGNGKSALLDAITWALWGKAARGNATNRQLLRLGEAEMWVDLVFDHEAQRYRVRRGYSKNGGTVLDFMVWDSEQQHFIPLDLPTLSATQRRIDALLSMDYTTFINSAFLLQGRADEFTRQPPARRKQVLSDILGLGRYDRLRELAAARLRRVQVELSQVEAKLESIAVELAGTEGDEDRLRELERAREDAENRRACSAAERDRLQVELAADDQARQRLDALSEQSAQVAQDIADAERDVNSLAMRIDAAERAVAGRAAAEERAERLLAARQERAAVEAAVARRRALEAEARTLQVTIAAEREKLDSERVRLLREVDRAHAERRQLERVLQRAEQIRQREEALAGARERLAAGEQLEAKHRALCDRRTATQGRIEKARAALREQLAGLQSQLRLQTELAAGLTATESELAQVTAALAAVREAVAEQEAARHRQTELKARFDALKSELTRIDEALAELAAHETLLAEGQGRCPVCRQSLDEVLRAEVAAEYDSRRRELQERRKAVEVERSAVQSEGRAAKARADALADRPARLAQLQQRCARLSQAAEAARAAAVAVERLRTEVASLEVALASGSFAAEDLAALAKLDAQIEALGYDPEQQAALRRAVDAGREVEREALELRRAQADDSRLAESAAAAEEAARTVALRIETEDFAQRERARLGEILAELSGIDADEDQLRRLDRVLEELGDAPLALQRVADAEAELPKLRDQREELERRIEARRRRVRELDRERAELETRRIDRRQVEASLQEAAARLEASLAELADLDIRRGELRARVERHHRLLGEQTELRNRQVALRRSQAVLSELVKAFGRDGIPAMIIDTAVPEIEAAANEVLGRLTGYSMQLRIRLQRPLVGGGESETLEVEISDAEGSRSFESYSGGEGFRISFALRLALSRLLAGRAGARLRTLIVDEGFGTQDEQGLEQLVAALHAVRDDFVLVLVVTHLSELKDRFPARIEVSKEIESGSRFVVVGDG